VQLTPPSHALTPRSYLGPYVVIPSLVAFAGSIGILTYQGKIAPQYTVWAVLVLTLVIRFVYIN